MALGDLVQEACKLRGGRCYNVSQAQERSKKKGVGCMRACMLMQGGSESADR